MLKNQKNAHSLTEFCGAWNQFFVSMSPMLSHDPAISWLKHWVRKSACTPALPLSLSLIVDITDICTHSIIPFPCIHCDHYLFSFSFLHLINWPPVWHNSTTSSNYFLVFPVSQLFNHHHQPHLAWLPLYTFSVSFPSLHSLYLLDKTQTTTKYNFSAYFISAPE